MTTYRLDPKRVFVVHDPQTGRLVSLVGWTAGGHRVDLLQEVIEPSSEDESTADMETVVPVHYQWVVTIQSPPKKRIDVLLLI